jgi:hypothetical protein
MKGGAKRVAYTALQGGLQDHDSKPSPKRGSDAPQKNGVTANQRSAGQKHLFFEPFFSFRKRKKVFHARKSEISGTQKHENFSCVPKKG